MWAGHGGGTPRRRHIAKRHILGADGRRHSHVVAVQHRRRLGDVDDRRLEPVAFGRRARLLYPGATVSFLLFNFALPAFQRSFRTGL
jgi:hypothetical protein